ncbi:PREDICTED: E3 ubiquitin/ISG15 ligase TRIM25-like [Nanorana parkeri]|uniref:E3 ubiquitin/ISG15 ligase TRIM25-like n=1 Tax=Nanorana parkeri TaxID=125878 RepID=UPI0008547BB3|nr:PREDICTED: E3 ubiquitin/ISG15 ligase TRIM25-like [Nanorana parkeri]
MASADMRDELECSICLNIYTDPVTLRCGHNFCRVCIDRVLDTQKSSGVYTCPECREEFYERPALRKNTTLSNIAQRFLCAEPKPGETRILCTNCIHASVPAVRTCLLCECSLCENHLRVHSTSPEHVLVEPTKSFASRKCPVHKKVLEYYCTEDAAYICVSCRLDGEHKKHKISPMKDIAEKKKEKLKTLQKKLRSKQEKIGNRVQKLKEHRRKAEEKAAGESQRVTAQFEDLKRRLEDIKKKVLSEISRQQEQASLSVSHLLKKLEIEQDELSGKAQRIEKLLKMTDPFTVLQERESLNDDSSDSRKGDEEDRKQEDKVYKSDLDEGRISETLYGGLCDLITCIKGRISPDKATQVLLDVDTACEDVDISGDLKTISKSEMKQYHPQRFVYYPQVLSACPFSSGRHSWEVEASDTGNWRIGVSYSTVDRSGDQSYFGDNSKSWCLRRFNNSQYSAIHDGKEVSLKDKVSSQRLKVFLDYELGQVSFYELCDPIRHLHTFTATFTQPLHAAFCVWDDWVKITT